MKKSKILSLYDNLHFLFILIILLILTLKYWYFCFLLILFLIFIYKKTELFFIGVLLCIFTILFSVNYYIPFNQVEFSGTVIEIDEKKAVVLVNANKIMVYHNGEIKLGDYGDFKVLEVDYNTDIFNYDDYLLNKRIKQCYKLNEFRLTENRIVIGKIKSFFLEKVDTLDLKYKSYIKALVLADKSELDIYEKSQNLGIAHLLAVSGMHISLLVLLLEFILKKIFYFEKPVDIVVIILLVFYLVITNFELTVLRAILMVILGKLFKSYNLHFTSLDTLSIVGVFLLLFNPRWLFLLSFELSFIVSFIIIIFGKNFEIKNKIVETFLIGLIAFLTTIPFIINTNYEINLLTILIGPIYVLYFELILYPLTLIMMFIPGLSFVFDYFFIFFETTITYFDTIKELTFIFGKISIISFLMYEFLLFFLLVSFEVKKRRVLFVVLFSTFLFLIYNKSFFNPFYQIKMYDVGQGDSFLITLPHNQGTILIDCFNNVDKYLKRDGIKKIDMIFLSHGHSDHINAYENVVEEFEVETTYSSYFDTTKELELLKNNYKIILLRSDNTIKYKSFYCKVFGPIRHYENENDNSLVMKIMIDNLSILFTGDIEREAENDLILKYGNELKSDILKAAHHGSNTSSSAEFLKYVSPENILISVGKNNWYGFPNNDYLLNYSSAYRTDLDGVITIYKRKKYFHIRK